MSFLKDLDSLTKSVKVPSNWVLVLYDQLTDEIGPLSKKGDRPGILIIESHSFFSRRPYHKQKIALVIANMRNFALELAEKGFKVEYIVSDKSHYQETSKFQKKHKNLVCMEPAEYEMRQELSSLVEFVSHEGWLTTFEDIKLSHKSFTKLKMDQFYRQVRKRTGILMEAGKPIGGKYSFDAQNREPWKGDPPAPEVPVFKNDKVKKEVCTLVEKKFANHPGKLDPDSMPATASDCEGLWTWVKDNCLYNFGAYEDAMSTKSSGVFHTRVSALMNIHRLTPKKLVQETLAMDIPLNSKEGFIRQVIGWREFVRHVHDITDGFRDIEDVIVRTAEKPGDGGYKTWSGKKFQSIGEDFDVVDGGAKPSYFGATNKLPPAFWGDKSGLNCLDSVVDDVWSEAYSHHITRLMILSNIATLLDISPRELTDWFWIAYSDAYDWVVEPNVIGMGTHAVSELMTTKPYISGANYINKMSDYCKGCKFDPKKNCPITNLYWGFLNRHKEKLQQNIRLKMPMNSLRKRSEQKIEYDRKIFDWVLETLSEGKVLKPENLPQD